jgi:hypothetical protein
VQRETGSDASTHPVSTSACWIGTWSLIYLQSRGVMDGKGILRIAIQRDLCT